MYVLISVGENNKTSQNLITKLESNHSIKCCFQCGATSARVWQLIFRPQRGASQQLKGPYNPAQNNLFTLTDRAFNPIYVLRRLVINHRHIHMVFNSYNRHLPKYGSRWSFLVFDWSGPCGFQWSSGIKCIYASLYM